MSAAYPSASAPNPFDRHGPIKVEERGAVIPSFYKRHERDGAGITVKLRGVPVPPVFTVDRVPVERRWAIRDDGELLDPEPFKMLYQKAQEEASRAFSADGKMSLPGNRNNDYIPTVLKYVAVEVDPVRPSHVVPMGYRAHAEPSKRTVPETLYSSDGEALPDKPIDVLSGAYFDDKLRKTLKPHEVEAVEAHLRAKEPTSSPRNPSASARPLKRVAKPRTYEMVTLACGREMKKTPLGLRAHKEKCHECQSAEAAAAAAS